MLLSPVSLLLKRASPSTPVKVERAKKCLDFASTTFIVHMISCCLFSGFPASLEWCACVKREQEWEMLAR